MDLGAFKFTTGAPWVRGDELRLTERTKSGDSGREVYRGSAGDVAVLVKVGRVGLKPGGRRGSLLRESRMLAAVREAGIKAPALLAMGTRRRLGIVRQRALIIQWLEEHTPLRPMVRSAAESGDSAALDKYLRWYVQMLAKARRCGFADRDFGAGNLLVPPGCKSAAELVWIDLEAVWRAEASDAAATAQTLAAAAVSWWVASRGDEARCRQLFELAKAELPAPRGGWPALMARLRPMIARRMAKQLRYGRIDRPMPVT